MMASAMDKNHEHGYRSLDILPNAGCSIRVLRGEIPVAALTIESSAAGVIAWTAAFEPDP